MAPLPGVKKASSGAFYYDDSDINMINIPIGACEGDYVLTPAELKRYFSLNADRIGKLPEYLIYPHLNSTWNHARKKITGRDWWNITGEIVAYRPIQWIPIVNERDTIPSRSFDAEYNKATKKIQTDEIYGRAAGTDLFELSLGGKWKGMKCERSSTSSIEIKAIYITPTEISKSATVEKGNRGNLVLKEIVLGMALQVERVFEHVITMYLNNEGKRDSLTWDGPESDNKVWVAANSLRDVGSLQFHPILMTGTGHSDSLWIQVLPVFDESKKLTDMHTVVSCKGWVDWYAYTPGSKVRNSGRKETLPLPKNKKPLVALVAAAGELYWENELM
jgi:hypothetical protein